MPVKPDSRIKTENATSWRRRPLFDTQTGMETDDEFDMKLAYHATAFPNVIPILCSGLRRGPNMNSNKKLCAVHMEGTHRIANTMHYANHLPIVNPDSNSYNLGVV